MSDNTLETQLLNNIDPNDPVELAHQKVKEALQELTVLSNNNATQEELDACQVKVKATVKAKNQALKARNAALLAMDEE